jgi:hypothetical protein
MFCCFSKENIPLFCFHSLDEAYSLKGILYLKNRVLLEF